MNTMNKLVLIGALLLISSAALFASDDDDHYSRGNRSEFYGTVEQLPDGLYGVWVVDGRQITVIPSTRIEQEYGRVAVGAVVEIEGAYDGRTFNAFEIEVSKRRTTPSDSDRSGF